MLLNFRGGPDMTIQEISAAAEVVSTTVDREANIIFGAYIDAANQEEVQVTLIATGLPGEQPQRSGRARPQSDPESDMPAPDAPASRGSRRGSRGLGPAGVLRRRRRRNR